MEYDIIIFWLVCFSCLIGLGVSLAHIRSAGPGWIVLYLLILLLCLLAWFLERKVLLYTGTAMWLLLVLLPAFLARIYYRRLLQQRYSAAGRLVRIISWLHPADGWRQQPEIVCAIERAERGEFATALELLKRCETSRSRTGLAAAT